MKILLIEDNHTIAKQILEFLSAHQWQLDHAHNASLGIKLAINEIYDVILLDLNLPDMDGLQACGEIKQKAKLTPPILMLTARDSFEDKAKGFNTGADDYLTKPFDLRELVLRCEALARRSELHQAKQLNLGELELDLNLQQAKRNQHALPLTHVGYQILLLLVQAHPEPISRSVLIHKLWGDNPPDSDALKSHIYALRKALDKPFATPLLHTVMNVGYKLECELNKIK